MISPGDLRADKRVKRGAVSGSESPQIRSPETKMENGDKAKPQDSAGITETGVSPQAPTTKNSAGREPRGRLGVSEGGRGEGRGTVEEEEEEEEA